MTLRIAAAGSLLALIFPLFVHAIPFGGQVGLILNCYNTAVFAAVGPPRGGSYTWSPATRTYRFGPPRYVGQWLLGLASAPYYCVYSILPVLVAPGIHIDMMGSSGPSASVSLNTALTQGTPPPSVGAGGSGGSGNGGSGGGNNNTGVGRMLIGEVFAIVDNTHGTDPQHEWVELYNGTSIPVNLSNWKIGWGNATTTIATTTSTLPPGGLVIFTSSTDLRSKWSIPTNVEVSTVTGTGNLGANDAVRLVDPTGAVVDAVSWGSNTTAFSPAAPVLTSGRPLTRTSVLTDTNSANDWSAGGTPSPGN